MSIDAGASDLGRYRLGRLLGRGGMGQVYLARDLALDRDVAIKFVAAERVGDEVATRRLLHEAHAAAALDHPCICTVHETGQTPDGKSYIVMQYVEGEPLSAVLRNGPLGVREALDLCAQIADALAAAHRHGIVHRDLKPSNVMMTPSGRPKLLDFGIAKQVIAAASSEDSTFSSGATAVGTIIGTPAYMSPEQIQQRPLDGRSDLFSLGALLFEALTGRVAFEGPTTVETIANVLHVHPPAPSTLRSDLDARHDVLCGRLLAKDAADRFQSAEEVVGAVRMLLSGTGATSGVVKGDAPPAPRVSRRAVLAGMGAAALAVLALLLWLRPTPLPHVPPEADVWYQRGVEAMREGAYEAGRRAFEQAIALAPQHVLAYARRPAELDNERGAQEQLLRVQQLVPDESRLPEIERLRLQAVRAAVLRQIDEAIALHRQLTARQPEDAGAWLDLGRAQEAAGLQADARASYGRAIALNRQLAVAHLRLGRLEGRESNRAPALAAFAESERLYRAASDVEGETEVLLARGAVQDAAGAFEAARKDLERAVTLAANARSPIQEIRAQLLLSRVMVSEGRFQESEATASAAVRDALENGLDTVAADGLIDLGTTLQQQKRMPDAEAQLRRAIQLAEQRGARRAAARARLQLAAGYETQGNATEALTLTGSVLPFLKANGHRGLETYALQIATRAHQELGELEKARQTSSEALALAERTKDEPNVALALTNLASLTTALGNYPEALRLRLRAEAIHRRQGDEVALPYDLANRADLLIRLGRADEAESALDEIDAARAAGKTAYDNRARHVVFFRAFAAATRLRCDDALRHLATVKWEISADTGGVLGLPLQAWCAARTAGRPMPLHDPNAGAALARERAYWLAATALERGDGPSALAAALGGLERLGALPFDELRWRLAAVGAAAAGLSKDATRRAELAAIARQALQNVEKSWKSDFETYGKRADVVYLIRRAGLS
jgi:tetratricopeptide (TPR) repeat protein